MTNTLPEPNPVAPAFGTYVGSGGLLFSVYTVRIPARIEACRSAFGTYVDSSGQVELGDGIGGLAFL